VPDALTASRILHVPKEEDYTDADDRPIPGAPHPMNNFIAVEDRPSVQEKPDSIRDIPF